MFDFVNFELLVFYSSIGYRTEKIPLLSYLIFSFLPVYSFRSVSFRFVSFCFAAQNTVSQSTVSYFLQYLNGNRNSQE